MEELHVVKRSGELQLLNPVKLSKRIEVLCFGLDMEQVSVQSIVDTIVKGMMDRLPTRELDELCAQTAAYMVTQHPDYGLLGGRIAISLLHKETNSDVFETFSKLRYHTCAATKEVQPLISDEAWKAFEDHREELQAMIDYTRDFQYEFFGYKTLERSYLLRADSLVGKSIIIERPQHMLLRCAVGIHMSNMERVKETYELLSKGMFTHATPTLFNAGTPRPQMSSCFLIAMKDDSIDGIYDTLKECAQISKHAGGIGLHLHNVRSAGSYISGTNGNSNGLMPLLRVYNNTARYVDQGGGRRKGSFAMYLEPWHGDIMDFLLLKRNTGKDEQRARDLFYGMWIPDLFMKRVESNGKWTLFDPKTAPRLSDTYGEEFEALYEQYEKEGRGVKTMQAHALWFEILTTQIETGIPYMLYKDACNSKSNQKNLGTIKCSNLCTEILEYTSPEETAVCNLASIAVPKFVNMETREFDFQELYRISKVVTRNLNMVIDRNYYPAETCRRSNMRHRPIGIGIQGLADAFLLMRLPFASPEAKAINEQIFECIYFAGLEASHEEALIHGPYETFEGSPASQGKFQFDLWGKGPASNRWDWEGLRKKIMEKGMRNSLLLAPMPTASTSQILGNNECFEPFTSNIYLRRVLSGEFPVINKHLVRDLIERKLWTADVRNKIIAHNGSVQNIDGIPSDVKELYKVVWEIKMRDIIDMAADRGRFIDQSQSLNLFLENPKAAAITSMHFYAWKKGLKTGMYYLRSRPAADPIKFTVDPQMAQKAVALVPEKRQREEPEECLNCGS